MRYIGLLAGIGLLLAVTGTAGAVTFGKYLFDDDFFIPVEAGEAQPYSIKPFSDTVGGSGTQADPYGIVDWEYGMNTGATGYNENAIPGMTFAHFSRTECSYGATSEFLSTVGWHGYTATPTGNEYVEFSMSVNAGHPGVIVERLAFQARVDDKTPSNFRVAVSTDGFATTADSWDYDWTGQQTTTYGTREVAVNMSGAGMGCLGSDIPEVETWDFSSSITLMAGDTLSARWYVYGTGTADGDTASASSAETVKYESYFYMDDGTSIWVYPPFVWYESPPQDDFTGMNTYNTSGSDWERFMLDNVALEGTVIPEPATLSLLALGGAFALIRRRRK